MGARAHPVSLLRRLRCKSNPLYDSVSLHSSRFFTESCSAMSSSASAVKTQPDDTQDEKKVISELSSTYPGLRKIILNRPRVLNSLDSSMIKSLIELYQSWNNSPLTKCIILKGQGRAFCSGGDVRAVYRAGLAGNEAEAKEFFRLEYQLNHLIATMKKPQVSLINGAIMGGGNGLAMHGAFRVATENALFAMPETAIGLHPDIGASFFLSRLPGYFGEYLGLTGARLDCAEMLTMGLATHTVPAERLESLENRLGMVDSSRSDAIHYAILEHCERADTKEGSIVKQKTTVDECFSKNSVEDIMMALEGKVKEGHSWCGTALAAMKRCSPTSLKVTLRSIREGRRQVWLTQCLQREYRLSSRAVDRTVTTDFYEGVRALLVDKDNSPKWNPSTLGDVSEEALDALFSPLPEAEELVLEEKKGGITAKL